MKYFTLLTGLKWAEINWKNVMSHISVHQTGFSNISMKMMNVVGVFASVASTVKPHPNGPDEAH